MDEDIDHAELYSEPARKRIKVNHLMNVFDQVRVEIGAKAILSKQLAKGALAWIPNEKLVHQIQDVEVHNTTLMNVVRNVHNKLCDEQNCRFNSCNFVFNKYFDVKWNFFFVSFYIRKNKRTTKTRLNCVHLLFIA